MSEKREINKYNKNVEKGKNFKRRIAKGLTIAAIAAAALTPMAIQAVKVQEVKKSAEIKDVNRSFKDINQENMGKYLKSEIESIYKKYPDLDKMIVNESEELNNFEAINDIFRIYKAYRVDEEELKKVNIDDVKVNINIYAETLKEGDKVLDTSHDGVEQLVTCAFLDAKAGRESGADLARVLYEVLEERIGLKENVLTSEEKAEKLKEDGYYYDENSNTFYTNTKGSKVKEIGAAVKTENKEIKQIDDREME